MALLALVTLSGQASCRSRDRADTSDYFPLSPDHTWVYEIARSSKVRHARLLIRARGDRFIEPLRQRGHVVEESYTTGEDLAAGEPSLVIYYRDGGFVHRAMSLEYRGDEIVEAGLKAGEERFLPVGLGAGSRWSGVTIAYDVPGPKGGGYAVEQTHAAAPEPEVVEVPAGRFGGCLRVETVAVQRAHAEGRSQGEPVVLYYRDWYAPDVGLVRSRLSSRSDHSKVLAETRLVSFVPGKPKS